MATVTGTTGNDSLVGTTGNDTINGLGGNDTLNGNGGSDFFDGGAGFDSIDFRATAAALAINFGSGTISGGLSGTFTGIERVQAGSGNDSIIGAAGGQNIAGQGGNDTLWGAAGNDTLWGGAANDQFVFRETGSANADTLGDFASGADRIVLDAGVMSALGASGNFATGDARFWASASGTAHDADDRIIYNTATRQVLYDADGNGSATAVLIATVQSGGTLAATDIVVEGGSSGAAINGTAGNDSIVGTTGDDTINGLGGNDTLRGGDGDDRLDGGDGNDSLLGGAGADLMIGGSGNDTLSGLSFSQNAPDQERAPDTLIGGMGDDRFEVDGPEDVISDEGGIDIVVALDMEWTLAAGFENLEIHNDVSESGFLGVGNELNNRIVASYAGSRLEGRGGNDTLVGGGGQGANHLLGGEGNDSIIGTTALPSRVDGGVGNDTLTGGTEYVFSVAPGAANADLIRDFSLGALIELDGAVHPNAGISGRFSATDARFAAGAGFTSGQDASDRVIYNTSTGQLFYDADGNGSGAALLIAALEGAPALTAHNIMIVNGNAEGLAITGSPGNDSLVGSTGADTIDGLAGNDTIRGVGGRDLLIGGDGNDFLIREDDGEDFLDEHFQDTLDGGLGDDVYDVYTRNLPDDGSSTAVIVDAGGVDTVLATVWTLGPGLENLTLLDRPSVRAYIGVGNELDNVMRTASRPGSSNPHDLSGMAGNDTLIGNIGSDGLNGGVGDDWLEGGIDSGGESDRLIGGSGRDSFVFREAAATVRDRVADFTSGQVSLAPDKIVFDGNAFAAIGTPGQFSANDERFKANASGLAGDPNDRVIYNTATGELWYDADGNGAGARVPIALLENAPSLVASDIVVDMFGGGGASFDGTAGNDSILGGSGNDTIRGFAGNDTLDGWVGNDLIFGGDGLDFLLGGGGNDTVQGDAGRDGIDGGTGNDSLFGGADDDDFYLVLNATSYGQDTIDGGSGIDTLTFSGLQSSGATVDLAAGTVSGGGASATDRATLINIENAFGTVFADRLTGNANNNVLFGGGGSDTLDAGFGNDNLQGGDGDDLLIGGAGDDHFRGYDGNDTQLGGDGRDEFQQFDFTPGGSGPGNDVLDGGAGVDTVRYDIGSVDSGIVADLSTGVVSGGGASGSGTASVSGVENVTGSFLSDFIRGDSAVNELRGSGGSDTLAGGLGTDLLAGGDGADRFLFDTAPASNDADVIADFAPAADGIVLDGSVMPALGVSGNFSPEDARFFAGEGANAGHDADDRVVYDTSSGQVWYDADGIGGNAAVLIATLQDAPGLVATHFSVINGAQNGSNRVGTSGNDTFSGTTGDDTFTGLGGNDLIQEGNGGNDAVDGGAGSDSIEYKAAATSALVVNFATGSIAGSSGSVSFTGIERVVAGNFNDSLTGAAGGQNLAGQNGNDTLWGAAGADTLWGGTGNDAFVFREMGSANADRVSDFASGQDKLQLDDSAFTAIGALGNFAASDARFWASSTGVAHDANDRVLYNTSTGQLYYDADGNGGGAAQLVATLTTIPSIGATDIQVI